MALPPRKTKILEVSSCFPPSRGGVETFVQTLTTGLVKKGCSVKVITSTRGLKPKFIRHYSDDVEVVRYPERFHLFEAPIVPGIAFSVLHEDYDILHIHGMVPLISDLAIVFARLRGKPVVLTYHNDAETAKWGTLGNLAAAVYSVFARFFVSFADAIVCSTRSYAMSSPVIRFFHKKLRIIPLGVDIARFNSAAITSEEQAKEDKHRLLFVGQLKQYKGVHVLIESMAKLRKEGHPVELGIVGTGPEYGNIRRLINDFGVEGFVELKGSVSDKELPSVYAKSDLLVLPSVGRREAFGTVLLEATASGKPVVATDTPGVHEVATNVGGHVSRRNDPHALADSIKLAIANRRDELSYKRIAESYSWETMVDRYHALFNDTVNPEEIAA